MQITIRYTNPEELRNEIATWLERCADVQLATAAEYLNKTTADQHRYAARALNNAAKTIREMQLEQIQ